jgi:hypothetical protein
MQICTFTCFCFLILIAARLKNIGGLDMKKNILSWRFFLLVVFSLIFLQNQLTAQCWPDINTPPHSALLNDYDGRNVAYVTKGGQGKVYWVSDDEVSIWELCKASGNVYGTDPIPTPDPMDPNNPTKIYYQISSGDTVTVQKIKLNTNTTLLVCGHLIVKGETSVEGDGDLGINNHAKIIVCPGGTLTLDELNANQHIEIVVDGTLVVNVIAGKSEKHNCIYGTGTIVNNDGTSPQSNISGFSYGTTLKDCQNDPNNFGGILPIDLLSFVSVIKPDRIFLNWTTGSEINNDYFTLERSRDLYGWEVLGFVEGAGNSSVPIDYSFSDLRPLDGLAYYRLKQTDFDGAFKYYGPIAAHYDLGLEGLDFKVMKSFSNWIIAVPNDGFYQVEVYNLQGHRLHSERVENTLSIPAPEGAVVIRVTDGFERSASRVVM